MACVIGAVGYDIDDNTMIGIYERVKANAFKDGNDHVSQVKKVESTIVGLKMVSTRPCLLSVLYSLHLERLQFFDLFSNRRYLFRCWRNHTVVSSATVGSMKCRTSTRKKKRACISGKYFCSTICWSSRRSSARRRTPWRTPSGRVSRSLVSTSPCSRHSVSAEIVFRIASFRGTPRTTDTQNWVRKSVAGGQIMLGYIIIDFQFRRPNQSSGKWRINWLCREYAYPKPIDLGAFFFHIVQSSIVFSDYQYGIQLTQRVDNQVLITFNARNDHDRTKFVEDIRESIMEMDEMENIRIEAELERQKSSRTNRYEGENVADVRHHLED